MGDPAAPLLVGGRPFRPGVRLAGRSGADRVLLGLTETGRVRFRSLRTWRTEYCSQTDWLRWIGDPADGDPDGDRRP